VSQTDYDHKGVERVLDNDICPGLLSLGFNDFFKLINSHLRHHYSDRELEHSTTTILSIPKKYLRKIDDPRGDRHSGHNFCTAREKIRECKRMDEEEEKQQQKVG
jgi:hypothetical protein